MIVNRMFYDKFSNGIYCHGEKVGACIFANRNPLLNAAIWKEEEMMIDFLKNYYYFYFPVASVLFFKQETIVLRCHVCSVGT